MDSSPEPHGILLFPLILDQTGSNTTLNCSNPRIIPAFIHIWPFCPGPRSPFQVPAWIFPGIRGGGLQGKPPQLAGDISVTRPFRALQREALVAPQGDILAPEQPHLGDKTPLSPQETTGRVVPPQGRGGGRNPAAPCGWDGLWAALLGSCAQIPSWNGASRAVPAAHPRLALLQSRATGKFGKLF